MTETRTRTRTWPSGVATPSLALSEGLDPCFIPRGCWKKPWLFREFQHVPVFPGNRGGRPEGDWGAGQGGGKARLLNPGDKHPSVPICPRETLFQGTVASARPGCAVSPIDLISTSPNPLRRQNLGTERLWNEEGKRGIHVMNYSGLRD